MSDDDHNDPDGYPPAGMGVTKIVDVLGERVTIEIDPEISEGIVAIGRELLNPMRHLGAGEAINISIEAREKLQKAAEEMGLMARITKESADDSDKSWKEQQNLDQYRLNSPAMRAKDSAEKMEDRLTIVGGKDGDKNDA